MGGRKGARKDVGWEGAMCVGGRGGGNRGREGKRACEGGREWVWRKGTVEGEGNEQRSEGERGGLKRAEEGGARKGGSNGASEMGKRGSEGGEQWPGARDGNVKGGTLRMTRQ